MDDDNDDKEVDDETNLMKKTMMTRPSKESGTTRKTFMLDWINKFHKNIVSILVLLLALMR